MEKVTYGGVIILIIYVLAFYHAFWGKKDKQEVVHWDSDEINKWIEKSDKREKERELEEQKRREQEERTRNIPLKEQLLWSAKFIAGSIVVLISLLVMLILVKLFFS